MEIEEQIKEFTQVLHNKFGYTFTYTIGKKYYKIIQQFHNQQCVYAFIDKDGNIYKPANWRSPAKHIRGHISDPFKDECCSGYGVKYLK